MGKRIIQQARGKGSSTYRVNKTVFKYRLQYPKNLSGEGVLLKIMDSGAHTCPIAKLKSAEGIFYVPAFKNMVEGQKVYFENGEVKEGNILKLKDIPVKTKVYCIESRPGDGGKYIKSGGTYATVSRVSEKEVAILMPSKKEKKFQINSRAIVGVVAGSGRTAKPVMKAGKKFYIKKTKSKLWPRTSAIKMNAIDHPFGSGRGKNPKSKIAKRNAPPGAKVGLIRPKRTGKKR
ncbi:MAG: 50S ribosomal protein L2 [Nanoarchaeota archaeon]|nr:50S ribosomal protein L2 [Nanoarchaeota archaeon]